MSLIREQLYKSFTGLETNILAVAGSLVRGVESVLREKACENRAFILAEAREVYDEFAKKFDIPLIPEPLESSVEQWLWDTVLGPYLQNMADRICGPERG